MNPSICKTCSPFRELGESRTGALRVTAGTSSGKRRTRQCGAQRDMGRTQSALGVEPWARQRLRFREPFAKTWRSRGKPPRPHGQHHGSKSAIASDDAVALLRIYILDGRCGRQAGQGSSLTSTTRNEGVTGPLRANSFNQGRAQEHSCDLHKHALRSRARPRARPVRAALDGRELVPWPRTVEAMNHRGAPPVPRRLVRADVLREESRLLQPPAGGRRRSGQVPRAATLPRQGRRGAPNNGHPVRRPHQ